MTDRPNANVDLAALTLPANHDHVVAAYRLILGREPESPAVTEANVGVPLNGLLERLLTSLEFRINFVSPLLSGDAGRSVDWRLHREDSLLLVTLQIDPVELGSARGLGHFVALVFDSPMIGSIIDSSDAEELRRLRSALKASGGGELVDSCTAVDFRRLYQLFLGRDAESVGPDAEYALSTKLALAAEILGSLEFKLAFVEPFVDGAPQVQDGFQKKPAGELVRWASEWFTLSASTCEMLDGAGSVAALAWLILTDAKCRTWLSETSAYELVDRIRGPLPSFAPDDPEKKRLHELGLELDRYPEGFDWSAYSGSHLKLANRWGALKHFLDHAADTFEPPPVHAGGEGETYSIFARYFSVRNQPYSFLLLDLLQRLRPLTADEHQLAADMYTRQGLFAHALGSYLAAAESPGATNTWTYLNAVAAAVKVRDFARGIEVLKRTRTQFEGETKWRTSLEKLIEAEFGEATAAAKRSYLDGDRHGGDRRVREGVAQALERLRELYRFAAPLPRSKAAKIVFLANCDIAQCTFYRVDQKVKLLERLGYEVSVFTLSEVDEAIEALPGAAAFLIYRQAAWPSVVRAILMAQSMHMPVIYDIDDLIFDPEVYPDAIETYGGLVSKSEYADLQLGVPLFKAAIELCDYALGSTPALTEKLGSLVKTGKAYLLPNGLDDRMPRLPVDGAHNDKTELVRIFYGSGTKAHNSDFLELAGPALVRTLTANPNARLVIAGHLALDSTFDGVLHQTTELGFVANPREYWALLRGMDVNLAVLKPGAMNDAKSEIKWLEAAYQGVPSIVSATDTYRQTLTDGHDVLLAADPEAWSAQLERMVGDADLRRSIAAEARITAERVFSFEACAGKLSSALGDILPQATKSGSRKPRILLVNVFFPPQTIGGATRVVRDNLDCWLNSNAAEALDFAVFSADEGVETPYRSRVEGYCGIPVVHLSTPQELNMDWRPFNQECGRRFRDFVELWEPDLVHFHCVQRLTASTLQVCLDAGVPYFVTAHDGWWISDHQFLVDESGRSVDPTLEAQAALPPYGVSLSASKARTARLKALLNSSDGVLAVSNAFADLYRSAGIQKVIAIPNGVPPLARSAKVPSEDGRVRLTHVGGMSAHKGYLLLREVLMGSAFANLLLTVVDHRRVGGAPQIEMWGATEVRFVGKTPQTEMNRFYAEQDVLLAPSIWPESYGLVTREALQAGLWVIASDRGAIGEDVKPGVNGFRVDVSGPNSLRDALQAINANAARYRESPPPTPLRSVKDQADELLAFYRQFLTRV